jgi:dipeptidyl aminopeptidase/acylaminoacyl peptidase
VKIIAFLLLIPTAVAAANVSEKPRPTMQVKAPVALAEYFKIRRISGASFNFDESLLAYVSDEGGRMDIWARPVVGGKAKQLTHVKGLIESFEFSPSSDQLVFAADIGGDEVMHLYFTDSKGKLPAPLSPDDPRTTRSDFIRWADDGKTLLYTSNRRDEKYMDLYEYNVSTRKSRLLWKASGRLTIAMPSRDHKRYIINEEISGANSNLYLLDLSQKTPRLLTPHSGDVAFAPTDLSPDGKTLIYTSDQSREFSALYAMDLSTKKSRRLLSPNWDVYNARYSRTGKIFYTSVDNDGAPDLKFTYAGTGRPFAIPSIKAAGYLTSCTFSKSDRWIAVRLESDYAPRSLWLTDNKERTTSRVFNPLPKSLGDRRFAPAKTVRVKSFDGRDVPALLFTPPGDGPFPAVLDIHGGPTSQSVRTFRPFTQYLVSKGYVVLVPNVRGSVGYGKKYTSLDNKDFGGGPLKDVLACKAWLVANAKVDAQRVAIMGQSYGGYMTLAAATFTPGEFAAHVDMFGIVDLKSLVESFPTYWASSATYLYQKFGNPNDPKDAQYQHDRSPLYFADRIERPLLVIQGANDARVKKDQSDRLVAAVRGRGVPVEYIVIEGEGHGFSSTENNLRALEAADRFLDRHVFGARGAVPNDEDNADVRRELETQYKRLAEAHDRKDLKAIIALKTSDFHAVFTDGRVGDSKLMEQYSKEFLERNQPPFNLRFTIQKLSVSYNKLIAVAEIFQEAARYQDLAGKRRKVETSVIQREIWAKTPVGWKLKSVDNVRDQKKLVDGMRVDPTKPYNPDDPPYNPDGPITKKR